MRAQLAFSISLVVLFASVAAQGGRESDVVVVGPLGSTAGGTMITIGPSIGPTDGSTYTYTSPTRPAIFSDSVATSSSPASTSTSTAISTNPNSTSSASSTTSSIPSSITSLTPTSSSIASVPSASASRTPDAAHKGLPLSSGLSAPMAVALLFGSLVAL
ncbi:hypothetical protein IE81DRAFT_364527 [Ceraceosorus guamensis]|uniref:REJ domain-containing protein n=1 Tax=Ceraceosorus guamensis TaxID=1522189 RepID=A0A316W504_9BASI|nr:hypothetical protein IE81DRAFT_364527 [Ceraceosorus guamensis]PWN44822.1 hypothetical protein IE81DRAFT_364527 [Ceraceosorus guamensis]